MNDQNLPAVSNSNLMAESVRDVKNQTAAITKLFKEVLEAETHYGVIPGTKKPTLYKPGAEKIASMLHLAPSFKRDMQYSGDHLTVVSECYLTHQATGIMVASAGAMCTTRETKYAYRQATRKCPKCGNAAIIKGKQEYGGGWVCFEKKGGCKAKWPDGAVEIEGQSEEREDNPNLADTYNTVLKISDKRAFVAATLLGTAASDFFTQDLEDFTEAPPTAVSATPPEPEPSTIERQLEAAFKRGQGKDFWVLNYKAFKAAFTDEEFALLEKRKDELKLEYPDSAGGSTTGDSPTPEPPLSGPSPDPSAPLPQGGGEPDEAGANPSDPDSSSKGKPRGRPRKELVELIASLEEAHKQGDPRVWWEANTTKIGLLRRDEIEKLNEANRQMEDGK